MYLKGNSSICLRFQVGKSLLEVFTKSDMSRDVDSSRSTFGYVMNYVGGVVSWHSRLQKFVALSTTELRVYGRGRGREGADMDEKFSQ